MSPENSSIDKMLNLNQAQKNFYDSGHTGKRNLPSRVWAFMREGLFKNFRKQSGMLTRCYDLHKEWMGDLSNKKVLDLGCFAGNYLSVYLAENAREYIGLDLSEVGIKKLQDKIAHISTAKAIAGDFLSDLEFPDKDFDIIYAYGVLHHFKDAGVLIKRLKQKLKPGGMIVSYDPLETNWLMKMIRGIYRPFQSDKEWEWPFTKKVYRQYANEFKIEDRVGIFGKSKYGLFFSFLPASASYKKKMIVKLSESDWKKSRVSDRRLFSSLHITMQMKYE